MEFTYSTDGKKIEIRRSDSIIGEIKFVNEVQFRVHFYDDKIITTYGDSIKWLEFDLNSKNQVLKIRRYAGNSVLSSVKLIWKNENVESAENEIIPNALTLIPTEKSVLKMIQSEFLTGNSSLFSKSRVVSSIQNEIKYDFSSFLNPMYNHRYFM